MKQGQQIQGTTRVIWVLVLVAFLPLVLNSSDGIHGGAKRATVSATAARSKRG